MRTLASLLSVLGSLLLALSNAFALTDQEPPTAGIVSEDFSPIRNSWLPVSGTWTASNAIYSGSASGISVITEYRGLDPAAPPEPELQFPEFVVRARMLNQGVDDSQLVGLVYGYQDSQNYYELVVSALGTVRMRTVMSGVAVDEAPAEQQSISPNTWFEVEVRWKSGVTTAKVNGIPVFTNVSQPEFTAGKVGFATHGAAGRFGTLVVNVPFGDQGFLETFAEPPFVTFTPQSGQWSVVNKTYRNSAVQQTSVTLAPIHTGIDNGNGETFQYTFRARMLNPYGASGNLVGIVFNYLGTQYTEVVFSPLGVATLNLVENGRVVRTLATVNYGGRRNVPFDVTLENQPNVTSVIVDGKRIFDQVVGTNPSLYPEGGVGLITHWSPGRFDNVTFDHGIFFAPCSPLTFTEPLSPNYVVRGTWDTAGGTLNNTSAGANDIVNVQCFGNSRGDDVGTNAVYSARLLNQYGASGNLVGLLYNYNGPTNYYEVVFSPTGIMRLNKVFQGVRSTVRTATHTVPRNTWFDVQVLRSGIGTTVKVNGVTRVNGQSQGELRGGSIGVITHWAKARFDNLTLAEHFAGPPSEL